MADYVIKISKEGEQVTSAADNELIFHSKYPLLKIHKQGSGYITMNNNATLAQMITIPHTVGVVPMFLAYTQYFDGVDESTDYKQFSFSSYSLGAAQWWYYKAWSDADNLYLYWNDQGGWTGDLNYYFFIFEEPVVT